MTALLPRIEGGTGADEALDAEIVAHFNNAIVKRYPPTDDFGPRDRWQFWSKDGTHFLGSEGKFPVPAYTSSLDDALALVERMLPGWGWTVYSATPHTKARAVLVQPEYRQQVGEHGSDPCRAVLAALLRALQEQSK